MLYKMYIKSLFRVIIIILLVDKSGVFKSITLRTTVTQGH